MRFQLEHPKEVLDEISAVIQSLAYSSGECVRYTLLLEEGLIKWCKSSGLSAEADFEKIETSKCVKLTLCVKGSKCYPFASMTDDSDRIGLMHDRLLSGTGSEIGYRYRAGTNYMTLTLPKTDHEYSLFKRNVWALAVPVAIQYLLTKVISTTDSILMGVLDQNSLAAISITASFSSLYTILLTALVTGTTIFASQYWGERDRKGINRVFSVSLRYSLICSVLFFIPSLFFPRFVMRFYTDIPELIDLGARYLRIISGMFLCSGFYQINNGIMRNTGKVVRSTVSMVCAAVVNFVLDIILIFGLFGLPSMGIEGAALATTISAAVHLVLSLIDYIRDKNIRISISFRLDSEAKSLIRDYLLKSFPLVVQMVTWTIADNICTSIFGHMDTDIVAANGVINIVEDLGTFALVGLYETCGILIGRKLGKNELNDAKRYGRRYLKYAGIVGIITAAGVFLLNVFAKYLPLSLTAQSFRYLHILLVVSALEIFFFGVNNIMCTGGFYAGGDTKALIVIDTINMWIIIVPIGLLCHYVLHLPAILIAIFLHLDELTSFPFKYARYKKYKWLKKIT